MYKIFFYELIWCLTIGGVGARFSIEYIGWFVILDA